MKALTSIIAPVAMLLLSGCGGATVAESENAVAIDCAIEIQIAVVSGRETVGDLNEGDWRVAAACVLPVHSTGGPGHVICNTDGAIIEIKWSDVRLLNNDSDIAFDGFDWRIHNPLDRRDGVSQTIGWSGADDTESFSTDFYWLATCELDTMLSDEALREQSDRRLIIRGRLLPETPPAQPLDLAELTELSL